MGAVTGLAGTALGGAISFVLSRQQIRDARQQRAEEFRRQRQRQSSDRRFEAYADFLTHALSFRNAIRGYREKRDPVFADAVNAIARSAHDASSLVFLVVESTRTYDALRNVVSTMSRIQGFLPDFGSPSTYDQWLELNNDMSHVLREFQAAARDELEIGELDRPHAPDRPTASGPEQPVV